MPSLANWLTGVTWTASAGRSNTVKVVDNPATVGSVKDWAGNVPKGNDTVVADPFLTRFRAEEFETSNSRMGFADSLARLSAFADEIGEVMDPMANDDEMDFPSAFAET